ncbi:hypothetical protein B8A40_02290, partial [Dolosigranulum pigrum]|uniref:hypothetical protein n=1 Tax=Dolosigranulum pigrum TaxID=29394 RepID=UPI000DC4A2C2
FKQDAIEKLKQFVPNLEDKEREVYENIIKKMNGTDNSEEKINEIVQVAIAEELLVQNKKSTSQVVIGRNRKNAQTSLDFVEGTSKDGQNYPEYKQELLKQKQRVQDLLNGQTGNIIPTPPVGDSQLGESDPKVTFASKREEVTKEIKNLEEKFKESAKDNSDGALTKEYNELYKKVEDLLTNWEQLASTDSDRRAVQGIRDILRGYKR